MGPTAVTADGCHDQTALRRVCDRVHVADDIVVERPDQLVFDVGEVAGAAQSVAAVFEIVADLFAAFRKGITEDIDEVEVDDAL